MRNSIIINTFYRMIVTIIEFYKFSYTNRALNKISLTLKRYFSNSILYKVLATDTAAIKSKYSFIIQLAEKILQNIIKMLNSLITRGINGSMLLKLVKELKNTIKSNSISFITFMIIGFIATYDVINIFKRTINVQFIIISILVVVLSILANYFDIKNVIKNSSIINGLVRIFKTELEE